MSFGLEKPCNGNIQNGNRAREDHKKWPQIRGILISGNGEAQHEDHHGDWHCNHDFGSPSHKPDGKNLNNDISSEWQAPTRQEKSNPIDPGHVIIRRTSHKDSRSTVEC